MKEFRHWEVRDGHEKDMERILSLRRTVFGEIERDKWEERFWRWEFLEGPEGKGLIYVVEDGERIIGHFADLPRRFSVRGKIVRGTLSVDLMVDPNYRRQGIFEAMGRYALRRIEEEGYSFTSAYPIRKETISGFKKIGWKEVVCLPVLVCPIRFSGIVNRYLHILPLSLLIGGLARMVYLPLLLLQRGRKVDGIQIEKVEEIDKPYENFLGITNALHPIIGIRDRNYMAWRYLNHPTRRYTIYRAMKKGEMQGYIILRKVDLLGFNSTVIVDVLTLDEQALMGLVEVGIAHSRREGVDLLGCMVPSTHPYHRFFRRYGFLRSPKTFRLMIHTQKGERLLDPYGWYVTWGDTDVI